MAVAAARRLEARMRGTQRVAEGAGARHDEAFVGSPAAGREALRYDETEAVLSRQQMLAAVVHKVGLHGGTQGVHMAVGVAARQNVLPLCERIEIVPVEQEAPRQGAKAAARTAPVGQIEVLRQRVGFVPGESHAGMRPRLHLGARQGLLG